MTIFKMMTGFVRKSPLVLCALGVAVTALAQDDALARAYVLNDISAGDLHATTLVEAPATPLVNTRRETVATSWQAANPARNAVPQPWVAQSRSYDRLLTGAALTNGIEVVVDAPGALLRLSSADRDVRLNAGRWFVEAEGQRRALETLSDQLVSGDDLRAAGLDVASGTLGLRLSRAVAPGPLRLVYDGALARDATFLLSVFDKNSTSLLNVQSQRDQFASAKTAAVQATFLRGDAPLRATLSGFAEAPDGSRYPLTFDGDGIGTLGGPVKPVAVQGLWQWQVDAVTRDGLQRSARTAFALAAPVARFDERIRVLRTADSLQIVLGIEARSAGRYEASAMLVGKDATQGVIAATAGWIEAGTGELTLSFDAQQLKAAGIGAPVALHDLTLRDQSRMSVQERRADALTF